MAKKTRSKQFFSFNNVAYIIIIALIFSPLTFLISNTFVSSPNAVDCYKPYPSKPNVSAEELQAYQDAMHECELQQSTIEDNQETQSFIIISIISLLAILATIVFSNSLSRVVAYGLFFGSALNTIISILRESGSHSFLASIFGTIVFIAVIIFINKELKQ